MNRAIVSAGWSKMGDVFLGDFNALFRLIIESYTFSLSGL